MFYDLLRFIITTEVLAMSGHTVAYLSNSKQHSAVVKECGPVGLVIGGIASKPCRNAYSIKRKPAVVN